MPNKQAETLDDDLLMAIDHANIARQSVEAARRCSVLLVLALRIEQLGECRLGQFRLVLCLVLSGEIELLGNNARDIDGELDLRVLAALHRFSCPFGSRRKIVPFQHPLNWERPENAGRR